MNTRDNVSIRQEGTQIIITIETDPAKVQEVRSASGKSMVTATTGGAAKVGDYKLNLTLYH